jgi:hypothetical protein
MWLTVSSSRQSPQSAHLDVGTYVIGRGSEANLVVADSHVSLRHAQLDVRADGVWLQDLQSTNGTFVSGDQLMRPVWLPLPSEFRVGETTVQLTVSEPAVADATTTAPLRSPPPPPVPQYEVHDAGPVAGGDVAIRGGRDAVGRDLIINEGFKLRSKMRGSAKSCIRLGAILSLAGFGVWLYFLIKWNSELFDVVQDPNIERDPDLPDPLPWLPLGAGMMFVGVVLIVTGLLIPRDRVVVPSDR